MTPEFSDPGWMVQVDELSDHVTVLNHWKASAVLTLERIKNADLDLPGYFFVPGLASVKNVQEKQINTWNVHHRIETLAKHSDLEWLSNLMSSHLLRKQKEAMKFMQFINLLKNFMGCLLEHLIPNNIPDHS